MASEPPQRRAVIDVGTNSVKLLVAAVAGTHVTPLSEESNQTRLGAGFYATRQLRPLAIARTAEAVAKYSARAFELGAASVSVIGTSATRDAFNSADLVRAIRHSSGLEMRILTGDEEAEWVFRGVTTDPKLAQIPVLILDVGGGSSEFIVGENSRPKFCASYPLGSVRLLESLPPSDPPGLGALAGCRAFLKGFLDQNTAPALEPALRQCHGAAQLVGTSGTASILARMEAGALDFNREQIETTSLSLVRIREMLDHLWQLPLARRREIPGLPPDRADVIATGMVIYEAIMERFGFLQLRISTRGLRYWAVLHNNDKDGGLA
jgi:exopolyphosphatase/guanosine-5'-triphosphate,3'-diphosphate pyrophosphatase